MKAIPEIKDSFDLGQFLTILNEFLLRLEVYEKTENIKNAFKLVQLFLKVLV